MAPSQVARRCCLPHLRGICPAKEHLRAWAEAMRRQDPRRFPVRRSAVNGMGTPHGADTTETVLHVDAATRLPDAAMPSQEGHHAGGLEQCDSPQDQAERERQSTAVMAIVIRGRVAHCTTQINASKGPAFGMSQGKDRTLRAALAAENSKTHFSPNFLMSRWVRRRNGPSGSSK